MLRSTILFCALTGSQVIAAPENRDLGQRLDHHLSVTWQGQQLGNALDRLEDLGRVPIWLDRRVDPNQTINLSAQELSLGNTLAKLAQAASGEVALVERLVYFGPQGAALEIATIREEFRASLGKVPSPVRSRWLERANGSVRARVPCPYGAVGSSVPPGRGLG